MQRVYLGILLDDVSAEFNLLAWLRQRPEGSLRNPTMSERTVFSYLEGMSELALNRLYGSEDAATPGADRRCWGDLGPRARAHCACGGNLSSAGVRDLENQTRTSLRTRGPVHECAQAPVITINSPFPITPTHTHTPHATRHTHTLLETQFVSRHLDSSRCASIPVATGQTIRPATRLLRGARQ